VMLTVILIVIAMSLVMLKVRLLGLEYGLRRVREASGLIRIGLELELVGGGVGGCLAMYLVFQVVNIFLGFSLGFGRNSYGKSRFSFHRTEYKNVFETYSECIAKRKNILSFP